MYVIHPPKILAIIVAGNVNQSNENICKRIPVADESSYKKAAKGAITKAGSRIIV
jgi:hypothetical protein